MANTIYKKEAKKQVRKNVRKKKDNVKSRVIDNRDNLQ